MFIATRGSRPFRAARLRYRSLPPVPRCRAGFAQTKARASSDRRRGPAGIERWRAARHGMRSRTALKALRVAAAGRVRPVAGPPASFPAPLRAREAYARRARPDAAPLPIARSRRRRTKESRRRSTSQRARYRLPHRVAHRSAPNPSCWPPNAVASRDAASRPPAHRGRRRPQRECERCRQHSNCAPANRRKDAAAFGRHLSRHF